MRERGRARRATRRSSTSPTSATSASPTTSRFRFRPMPPTRSRRSTAISSRRTTASTATAPRAPARIVNLRSDPPQHRRPTGDGGTLRARQATARTRRTRESSPPKAAGSSRPRSTIAPTMAVGLEIRGPAIVEQPDTTTLIEPGWRAHGRRRRHPDHHRRLRRTSHDIPGNDRVRSTRSPSKSFATSSTASPTRCSRRCCSSSFSPIVKEGLDASASLFTADGETLAQACSIPIHLATLIPAVAQVLETYPARRRCATATSTSSTIPTAAARICPTSPSSCRSFIAARSSRSARAMTHHQDVGGMSAGIGADQRDGDLPGGPADPAAEAARRPASSTTR